MPGPQGLCRVGLWKAAPLGGGCPPWRDLPRAGRGRAVAQDKPPKPPAHGKPGSSPRCWVWGYRGDGGADLGFRFREGWAGRGWNRSAAGLTREGNRRDPTASRSPRGLGSRSCLLAMVWGLLCFREATGLPRTGRRLGGFEVSSSGRIGDPPVIRGLATKPRGGTLPRDLPCSRRRQLWGERTPFSFARSQVAYRKVRGSRWPRPPEEGRPWGAGGPVFRAQPGVYGAGGRGDLGPAWACHRGG